MGSLDAEWGLGEPIDPLESSSLTIDSYPYLSIFDRQTCFLYEPSVRVLVRLLVLFLLVQSLMVRLLFLAFGAVVKCLLVMYLWCSF